MLREVINNYEFIFNRTLGTWKIKPVGIYLQPVAKPYHAKPYPMPRSYEAIFRTEV